MNDVNDWASGERLVTAFEVVCGWSVSQALSFMMSQLLRATAGVTVVCLSAIFLSHKQP